MPHYFGEKRNVPDKSRDKDPSPHFRSPEEGGKSRAYGSLMLELGRIQGGDPVLGNVSSVHSSGSFDYSLGLFVTAFCDQPAGTLGNCPGIKGTVAQTMKIRRYLLSKKLSRNVFNTGLTVLEPMNIFPFFTKQITHHQYIMKMKLGVAKIALNSL